MNDDDWLGNPNISILCIAHIPEKQKKNRELQPGRASGQIAALE
jgi:hypothetical protein